MHFAASKSSTSSYSGPFGGSCCALTSRAPAFAPPPFIIMIIFMMIIIMIIIMIIMIMIIMIMIINIDFSYSSYSSY